MSHVTPIKISPKKMITQVLFHVQLENFNIFILNEPIINVQVKVAEIANIEALQNFNVLVVVRVRKGHHQVFALLREGRSLA